MTGRQYVEAKEAMGSETEIATVEHQDLEKQLGGGPSVATTATAASVDDTDPLQRMKAHSVGSSTGSIRGMPKFSIGLWAAVIGTVLEYYDFSVYAYFTPEIAHNFFPSESGAVEAVETFAVFAGGYLMRPIGSLLLGAIGDRFGTGVSLFWSIVLMTVPTVCVGLLPTYAQVGMFAPAMLTMLRLLQGLSVGGELVGALFHAVDRTSHKNRGLMCGLLASCGTIGGLMGSLLSTLMHAFISKEDMRRWGWRIPFLCGSLLGVVGILLRTKAAKLSSRQRALKATAHERSYKQVLSQALLVPKRNILAVALLSTLNHCVSYTNFAWIGTYLVQLAPRHVRAADAFGVTTTFSFVFLFANIFWGWFGDWSGWRRQMTLVGVVISGVASPLLFLMLTRGSLAMDFTYGVIAPMILAIPIWSTFYAFMSEQFEYTPARYIVTSIAYNVGSMVGGAYPTLASELSRFPEYKVAPLLPIPPLAIITFIVLATWIMRTPADRTSRRIAQVQECEKRRREQQGETYVGDSCDSL